LAQVWGAAVILGRPSFQPEAAMAGMIRELVGSLRSEHRAHRRSLPSGISLSALEASIAPQRNLASAVGEMAQQLTHCFETLRTSQRKLMHGVEGYLGFDAVGVDQSAMALVAACAGVFETYDTLLSKHGLQDVRTACEGVLKECDRMTHLLQSRDEANAESQHYEEKVLGLMRSHSMLAADDERLTRNHEKRMRAGVIAEQRRHACEAELRAFAERGFVQTRSTLHALLHIYVRLLADLGRHASAVVDAFNSEFQAGVSVELVGLRKAPELNGLVGIVEGLEEQAGRYTVSLPDGSKRALRPENMMPVNAHGSGGLGEEPTPSQKGAVSPVASDAHTAWCGTPDPSPPAPRSPAPTSLGPAVGFGAAGYNIELSAAADALASQPPSVAWRRTGLVNGITLTAAPLSPLGCGGLAGVERYYLEAEVLEVAEKRSGRTMALGFAWPLPGGHLPETAAALPRAFVVGGDLPRAHLGGRDLGKVSGWRPVLDVAAGTRLGWLLEADAGALRLSVLQDGTCRCVVEAARPEGWFGPPHGVVDVCGTVRRVQLRQGAPPLPSAKPSPGASGAMAGA